MLGGEVTRESHSPVGRNPDLAAPKTSLCVTDPKKGGLSVGDLEPRARSCRTGEEQHLAFVRLCKLLGWWPDVAVSL